MDIIKFIGSPRFNGTSIIYSAIIREYYDNGERVSFETRTLDFYGDGFIFANEFLARMNKTFGTNYEFSESYKDEVGKKHGNNNIHKDFVLRESWGDSWEILQHYDYDSVKGCAATYGDYTKETLIAFADAVADYNKNGVKPKDTDFHPNYKIDREEEIAKEYIDGISAIDAEVKKATDALAVTLSGDALTNAVNAVKEGYRWSYTRCRDKKWDAERNLYLDEMANAVELMKPHIKRYKDYFDYEVFNTKSEHYYSSDHRYSSRVELRYGEKNGESFFNITPYENNGVLMFSFVGQVSVGRWHKEPIKVGFNLYGLTIEEVEVVNHEYNQIWYNAKFNDKLAFAE